MDHQLNLRLSEAFGNLYLRLPLTRTARIIHGNALTTDWGTVAPKDQLSYILGNPPFVGAMLMDESQRQDLLNVAGPLKSAGVLDYVAAWYLKAAQYVQGTAIRVALVSTNSITQGEQVSILWSEMLNRYKVHIQFAHRTFKWSNEARGNANVFCVIVGFGQEVPATRRLFDYATPKSDPQELKVNTINPYLVDGPELLVANRSQPISNVPPMRFGSMPRDGGNLILTEEEKDDLLAQEPQAEKWIRPYVGSQEFINRFYRYCLWLDGISPSELKNLPLVLARVNATKAFRLASSAASTRGFAATPTLFCQIAQPGSDYLLMPGVSSERRQYVPIGFLSSNVIANNLVFTVPNATPYLFGVLTSQMHMAWMRQVCGRLKSDYRYSKDIVYNNFPFPQDPGPKRIASVEAAAQAVLAARAQFPSESLATLYDQLSMPPTLVKAHQQLDRAVDQCYRLAAFPTELSRLEYLFGEYRRLTEPVLGEAGSAPKPKRPRKALSE
jgi:hypothetical protein